MHKKAEKYKKRHGKEDVEEWIKEHEKYDPLDCKFNKVKERVLAAIDFWYFIVISSSGFCHLVCTQAP